MIEKKFAGLYWTKEDIDSACQVYAIHIAVTNRLVCTIDTDVPSAEAFTNLFAAAPDLLEACEKAKQFITNGIALGYIRMPDADTPDSAHDTPGIIRAAIAKAKGVELPIDPEDMARFQREVLAAIP